MKKTFFAGIIIFSCLFTWSGSTEFFAQDMVRAIVTNKNDMVKA